jgi:hypothetical protein
MIASISFGVRVRYLPPYGLPKRSHASHARVPQNISAVGSTDTTAEAGLWFQFREGVGFGLSVRHLPPLGPPSFICPLLIVAVPSVFPTAAQKRF